MLCNNGIIAVQNQHIS